MTQAAPAADSAAVDHAITSRASIRAFSDRPVDRTTITDILRVASRAPSGTNTQPWKVYVLEGAARDRLVARVCAAQDAVRDDPSRARDYQPDYDYYPTQWVSPFIDRRRQNGWALYGLLGIGKGDRDRMHAQSQRNYRFFDAPVGLMFTVDRIMGRGSLLDYGMFLQNIMVAARGRGLHTCPQAAWNDYANLVKAEIGAGENEMLVCGMALGWALDGALVNTLETPRETVESFTRWLA